MIDKYRESVFSLNLRHAECRPNFSPLMLFGTCASSSGRTRLGSKIPWQFAAEILRPVIRLALFVSKTTDSETKFMAMKREKAAVIRHQKSSDGKHAVDAQLRVLILPSEDGGYIAQGLEIDYLTTGQTVEEVKANFAHGLLLTIEAYIKRNRPLDALFAKGKTPAEAWGLWLESENRDVLTCGTVVALDIPKDTNFFKSLSFREAEVAHAA